MNDKGRALRCWHRRKGKRTEREMLDLHEVSTEEGGHQDTCGTDQDKKEKEHEIGARKIAFFFNAEFDGKDVQKRQRQDSPGIEAGCLKGQYPFRHGVEEISEMPYYNKDECTVKNPLPGPEQLVHSVEPR